MASVEETTMDLQIFTNEIMSTSSSLTTANQTSHLQTSIITSQSMLLSSTTLFSSTSSEAVSNLISSTSNVINVKPKSKSQKRLTLDDILGQYWEYNAARDLCLYGYPVILILGTVGNLLTLLVMLKSMMRKRSTGFYMAVLSIFDTLVLYFACFRQWLSLLQNSEVLSISSASCKTFNFLSYTFFDVAVWLLVVMTLERYLVVQFPLFAQKIATIKRARFALVILLIIMSGINAHFFWTVSLDERDYCKYTEEHNHFHDNIWPWIDATVYSFMPFVLLLIFNVLIIIVHRRATVLRKTTIRIHRNDMSSANNAGVQFRLSSMLLSVTMTFLLLSAPNVILICIRHKYFDFSVTIEDFHDLAVYRFVAMVTNFCLYLNHAINFFLYCISGERFRRELINVFTCRKSGRRAWSTAFSDVTTRTVHLSESSVATSPGTERRAVRMSESPTATSPEPERRSMEQYI